jgi:putative Mn2+ efflux pump MntP
MDFLLLLAISFGLAMDSFAVALAKGAAKNFRTILALKLAIAFAIAHFLMTVFGWFGGSSVIELVGGVDHWIAFALLLAIGGKMIYGASKAGMPGELDDKDLSLRILLMLSLATSVDALVIGVSFAFLDMEIWGASAVIAITIFAMTLLGAFAGKYFYKFLGHKAEILGGVVLIGIGLKTLIEHLQKTI